MFDIILCLTIRRNGEERNDVRISFQSQSGITDTVPIKYKHIGPFLTGEWSFDEYAQKLLSKGEPTH